MQGSAGIIGPEGPTGPTGVKVGSENNIKNKLSKEIMEISRSWLVTTVIFALLS